MFQGLRWVYIVVILVVIVALAAAFLGSERERHITHARQFLAMGTIFEITLYDSNLDSGERTDLFQECEYQIRELERLGNPFDPNSDISLINQNAIVKPLQIQPELFQIISYAVEASQKTQGAFDITVKPIIDYFKIKKESISTSEKYVFDKAPQEIVTMVGYENIVLDAKTGEIFLKNKAQLDLSGMLKGYGVDRLVTILKARGVKHALVNGGGNLYCIGLQPNQEPWEIGIKDPNRPSHIASTTLVSHAAVSTSAGYERSIEIDGKRYSHIVDPRSGVVIPCWGSVTVIHPSAMWADIYSTAIFIQHNLKDQLTDARVIILK